MLRKASFFIVGLFFFIGIVPIFLGYWVFDVLKKQPEIAIVGNFKPAFFATKFSVEKASIHWEDKITAKADRVEVDYHLFEWMTQRQIHLRLKSDEIDAELEGDLKSLAPEPKQLFHEVVAEVTFKEGKLIEIYQINARSKDVHLRFGLSNRQKVIK